MRQGKGSAPVEGLKAEAFIRGESTYSLVCDRPFDEVALQLEGSIAVDAFPSMQVHDLGRLRRPDGMALGVTTVTTPMADLFKFDKPEGALVSNAAAGGRRADGGEQYAGQHVDQMRRAVFRSNTSVALLIQRDGNKIFVPVRTG